MLAFTLLVIALTVLLVVSILWRRRARHPMSADREAGSGKTVSRAPVSRSGLFARRPIERRLELPVLRPKIAERPEGEAFAILSRRRSPTRHPIVLAHGYMGFDSIGLHGERREYFLGVRQRLEALGHTVHRIRVAPAGAIRLRATQLANQIRSLPAERVNIIAHSMGGLDARYAIARLGLGDRVASLTTIGTPHRGTPLADTGALWIGEWRHFRQLLDALGANVDGLYDLTTQRMEQFNRMVPDVSSVYYSSVVGAVSNPGSSLNAILAAGHAYLLRRSGSNDGIVPAESQKWGEVVGQVDADHWEQIGWSGTFDAQAFYASLAEHLAAWGL